MSLKVYKGTPNHKENLCDTCRYCTHIEGHAPSKELRFCESMFELPIQISFPVARCTDYRKRDDQNLDTMKEMAWILDMSKGKRPVGFISAAQFREKYPDQDI